METLQKGAINEQKLKSLILRLTATELANLSQPCYMPPLKSPYFQILDAVNLKEADIREFTKSLYKDHPAKSWSTHNVPATNLMLLVINYFLKEKNQAAYLASITYLLIRFYSNLMNKYMPKFCDESTFRYALENLTRTHLFVREKTISNGIMYLAKELDKRYRKVLEKLEPNGVAKFITEARHRMNQSWKSFAQNYHRAASEGKGIRTQTEPEEEEEFTMLQTSERGQRTIEELIKRIVVNKLIDRRALEDARKITRAKSSIANTLAKELTDLKYADNLRMIFKLFTKELTSSQELCGSQYINFVKKLMAVKRTRSAVYFKQQVIVLLERMVENLRYVDWYRDLTNQTKFILASFLAYYLTSIIRNVLCG